MRILVISDLHANWPALGSVGQPRDADPRASFAVIEDGNVALKRVAYDVERTVRDLHELPIPPATIESLVSILRDGR